MTQRIEQLTLIRRLDIDGDAITNQHLRRLATEGWSIVGAETLIEGGRESFSIDLERKVWDS